jgi:DNA-binding GntR family transcriptional regulator
VTHEATTPSTAAPPESVTSQRIATALKDAILAGEIPPGEWLRQDEIAVRFGASRLPVREALRILESEGLAVLSPNRGARVPELSLREVNTYYRMRERLEPLTLIESLEHITDTQIDRMEGIQREIELNTDVSRFLVLDREFHMTSYAACPSGMLLATTVRLWNSTQHYRRAFMLLAGNDRAAVVNAEHRLLLDAISRRDAEDSERFLVGHIRRTRVALTSHPEVFASD